MIVLSSVAPIFSEPPKSELTPIADEIPCGWSVSVEKSEGEFSYIRTEYGYNGWMRTSEIADGAGGDYEVGARFCDLLPTEEYNCAPLISLPRLARVKLISSGEKWSHVQLPDGRKGFVRSLHIRPRTEITAPFGYESSIAESAELRSRIVASAVKYLETPYRWGGKTSFGIDCSGLTFMAYAENGINIYRDAEPDTRYTRRIPLDEAKPGDLLFFPGHIAMHIGNQRFIHASSALSMVGFNSLNPNDDDYSEYLKSIFITAATVFSDN